MKDLEKKRLYIGTGYCYRGLSSRDEKKLFKDNFPFQKPYELRTFLAHYSKHWKQSKDFHKMNEALWAAAKILPLCLSKEEHLYALKVFSSWISHVDNWAHSDALSSILANLLDRALQSKDKSLIKEHRLIRLRWNTSRSPWFRRQSIVSLLNYSRLRKKTLSYKEIIFFVNPLLQDRAFYVQKAVGWTLRETYNLYPQQTYRYLKEKICVLSSVAFSAATEKLNKNQKNTLLFLRRKKKRII